MRSYFREVTISLANIVHAKQFCYRYHLCNNLVPQMLQHYETLAFSTNP